MHAPIARLDYQRNWPGSQVRSRPAPRPLSPFCAANPPFPPRLHNLALAQVARRLPSPARNSGIPGGRQTARQRPAIMITPSENRLRKAVARFCRPSATAPVRPTTDLSPELRLAAAIIFQAFKDATHGPQSRREEAHQWLRSETAALWLSALALPPENLERALQRFPLHSRRANSRLDPVAARKAYQTRRRRGNWMDPWEK